MVELRGMTDEQIIESSKKYAKENKKIIAGKHTSKERFPAEKNPVSVFMAGSPGAGKTEASVNLLKKFSKDGNSVIRIDPDDLRPSFKEYTGKNSSLFQAAISILVDKIHDNVLSNEQSFIFDSTFTNLTKAKENIDRSLNKNRFVQILYVYQDPLQAWAFVKEREKKDGRNIPKDKFIEQYFQARENVNILKRSFNKKIQVDLLTKNIDGTDYSYETNITVIDNYVPERYNKQDLELLLIE